MPADGGSLSPIDLGTRSRYRVGSMVPGEARPDLAAWLRRSADAMEQQPVRGDTTESFERYVLRQGRPFASAKLTEAERRVAKAAIDFYRVRRDRFRAQECFMNSQEVLFDDETERLTYVEGFAWTHTLFPVLHGWLAINDKVVDVTLPPTTRREASRKEPRQVLGEFDGRSYFGVPFDKTYVAERKLATRGFGSLLDDLEHGYPLLRQIRSGATRGASTSKRR
jgi:hypothetical protein